MELPEEWKSWSQERKLKLFRELRYNWKLYARPDQLPPKGDWLVWILLAGRGAGKTRSGAEYCREFAMAHSDARIAVIAPTYGAARDVAIEGESGLLAVLPPDDVEKYNKSLGEVRLKNGAQFKTFSGQDPERLRGPQHHLLWCEELAAWPYPRATWDMAQFGLRLGTRPRTVITSTPRPIPLLKDLAARSQDGTGEVVITRASTFANAANLPEMQLRQLRAQYSGTYLGMQELEGLLLDDIQGALWQRQEIDRWRVDRKQVPPLTRIVVGVDPAATSHDLRRNERPSDLTGIVVVGRGVDHEGYVLGDYSMRGTPNEWGRRVVRALNEHMGDRIVAERNNGGEMVEYVIRTIEPNAPVKSVWASRGKQTRAEPISSLYQQGRVHHLGVLPQLEDEMCSWVPTDPTAMSPDRVDALVWACTEVLLNSGPSMVAVPSMDQYSIPML